MSYMVVNNAIFIEGMIEEKYFVKADDNNKDKAKNVPYGFKVKNVMLLGNVSDTFIKGLSLKITTPQLSPEFRDRLLKMIKSNKGSVPLTMSLYDPEKKWTIDFLSRKFKVAVTAPLIEELERHHIGYSVLKK